MRSLALALGSVPPAAPTYPFGVGEEFQYSAKLGVLRLGTARMAVTGIDTVRGVESFVFTILAMLN